LEVKIPHIIYLKEMLIKLKLCYLNIIKQEKAKQLYFRKIVNSFLTKKILISCQKGYNSCPNSN